MSIDRTLRMVKVVVVGDYRGAKGAIWTEKWKTKYEEDKAQRNAAVDQFLAVVDWEKVVDAAGEVEKIGCWKCREENLGMNFVHEGPMILCSHHLMQHQP